jgi:type I restriction enzyme M protein
LLLVYAARHFRGLSNQNELRPQDVMRILVHTHAYGEAARVPALLESYSRYIGEQVNAREHDEVERLEAEYTDYVASLEKVDASIAEIQAKMAKAKGKTEQNKVENALTKLVGYREKLITKLAERDEKIGDARRRAQDDRNDVEQVGKELIALYGDEDELLKHSRVVGIDEIEENEFNLNIPRYVDTFEPEPKMDLGAALRKLREAERGVLKSEDTLARLIKVMGYAEKA